MAFSSNPNITSLAAGSIIDDTDENQFSSSISNLTLSKLNITSSKSAIPDVDFAEEAANFAKMQVLTKAGVFALVQGNQLTFNLLNLLRGGKS